MQPILNKCAKPIRNIRFINFITNMPLLSPLTLNGVEETFILSFEDRIVAGHGYHRNIV